MTERSYTSAEAKALAREAIREALVEFAAANPVPATVSVSEAAKVLKCSPRTVARMPLPRVAGRIPYSAVLEMLASR